MFINFWFYFTTLSKSFLFFFLKRESSSFETLIAISDETSTGGEFIAS